ncbi:MAG: hypothetical protein JWQ21_3578 [Herminiimonas sp.]|nr:hypothetical protein [Herminiimonas sp.]
MSQPWNAMSTTLEQIPDLRDPAQQAAALLICSGQGYPMCMIGRERTRTAETPA